MVHCRVSGSSITNTAEPAGHGGDAALMLEAADAIGAAFDVDLLKVKQHFLTVFADKAKRGEAIESFVTSTQGTIDEAQAAGRYDVALDIATLAYGLSHNLRNNAVYDRRWDWVLIGPADGATRIQPKLVEKQRIAFSWESRGSDLEVVFRPLFYQKHKNLKYYQPWTYKVWKDSVSGYCTWWPRTSVWSTSPCGPPGGGGIPAST